MERLGKIARGLINVILFNSMYVCMYVIYVNVMCDETPVKIGVKFTYVLFWLFVVMCGEITMFLNKTMLFAKIKIPIMK